MTKTACWPLLSLLLLAALPAAADEPCPCPPEEEEEEAPEPLWKAKVGLSYLATTGNTESATLGLDARAERRPDPWGVGIFAVYDRTEDSDVLQSERTFAGLRGKRSLDERWELFAEGTAESDEFAGFDPRLVFSTGATYHVLLGPPHLLDVDLGLSYTDVDRLAPEQDQSYAGGLLGLRYTWEISERSAFRQRLVHFPNFETSSAWRLESASTLEASVNEHLALRLGYEVRYENEPPPDRDDTDTTTRVSLVVNL